MPPRVPPASRHPPLRPAASSSSLRRASIPFSRGSLIGRCYYDSHPEALRSERCDEHGSVLAWVQPCLRVRQAKHPRGGPCMSSQLHLDRVRPAAAERGRAAAVLVMSGLAVAFWIARAWFAGPRLVFLLWNLALAAIPWFA